jgi:hypothetical protein
MGSATIAPVLSNRSAWSREKIIDHRSWFAGEPDLFIILIFLLFVLGFFSPIGARGQALAAPSTPSPSTPSTDNQPGRAVPLLGNQHLISPGTPHEPYNSNPPTSGSHVRWMASWGVHKVPIPLEVQVHNLEDGGVVVQYKCTEPCPDLVAKLEALTQRPELLAMSKALVNPQGPPSIRLVVAPYPAMTPAIALTAWGRIETLDHYDEVKILRFIKAYIGIDHHPATPEK